jgi:hypothetical protein
VYLHEVLIYTSFISVDGHCILQKPFEVMNEADGKNNKETWAMWANH